ncbi:5-oxoprolinase subunit PxpB [Fodinicurvata sp. EGI_FJ10296]|uniref:5-oxoprolinase subunit PxpB n=1 Tax=Fodinicurvata sp. EGI_FJ10296 TaxID=3231908 RepID=UPI00345465F9
MTPAIDAREASDEKAYRLLPAGDRAVTVELGAVVDPVINARVRALDAAIANAALPGIIEAIPTYRSLQLVYDPVRISPEDLRDHIDALIRDGALDDDHAVHQGRHWTVPVAYGGDNGMDLDSAADLLGLSADDVMDLHQSAEFTVAMIGFQPGFTYLSGLPEALHLSRMDTPRTVTPSGSVSIGGIQGAISSVVAPSAWHLLGRTPVRAFDLRREDPFLFRPGDTIRFSRIDTATFGELAKRADRGEDILAPETPPAGPNGADA